jgi:ABC-2 type transport system permease protein
MGKYFKIFSIAFNESVKNYKALIGLSLFLLTCLLIFANLWKVLGANAYSSEELLLYIAFNEWVLIAFPDIHETIEEDIVRGNVAEWLVRPISYLGAVFSEGMAIICVHLVVLGIVTFTFTGVMTGTLLVNPLSFLFLLFLGFLAGVTGLIFRIIVGLSAFWVKTTTPLFWLFEKLLFMLGGLMLPLSAYPEWLQKIARLTPFAAILGDRSALVMESDASAFLWVAFSLFFWTVIGLLIASILFQKGVRRLELEGA